MRRAILARLVEGEATVNELPAPFPMSAQAVGKHMRVLERAVPLSTVAMDVRAGGAWRARTFCGPRRHEIRWTGEYREVAAPERLVLTFSDTPGEDYELVTVVLTDIGDGRTQMRFEQKNGWGGFFARLDERLVAR
jgi:uncharacterized protein YndB with AHSA1/START domain